MNDAQYATMLKGFADLATRMSEGFTRMEKRFDEQDAAHQEILEAIGSYIQDVEYRWDKKWTNHDQRLARLEQ
jgi:hypothetical protein